MPTITQDIAQVRTAVLAKDAREAIADALEKSYYQSGHLEVLGLNVSDDDTGLVINTTVG